MGCLETLSVACSDVGKLKNQYGCSVFVETGCYLGTSLRFALTLGFKKVFSCDIVKANIDHCLTKFQDPSLEIYHLLSVDFLEKILPQLADEPSIMFWLDAHLPDNRLGQKYDLPLEEEFAIINKYRPNQPDVVCVDDLRIYEDGNYSGGSWDRGDYNNLSLSFLEKYNYNIQKFYHEEGYMVITR
jgi:hypothetical protein